MTRLVSIQSISPNIVIDLRYATRNNFLGEAIYSFTTCSLHEDAAHALHQAQLTFEAVGLGLKVWDGFRPLSAQWKLWEKLPDERYVADPRKGGRHTRGTAVDLTLIDLTSGKELPMPTLFDDFSEKAHRDHTSSSQEARKNHLLLEKIMVASGFAPYPTEWWHYDLAAWESYPVIPE